MWGQPPPAVRRAQPGSTHRAFWTQKGARDARPDPHHLVLTTLHFFVRMANSSCPYSIGWPLLPIFFTISPAMSDSISFSSFIASTMHSTCPTSTVSPTFTKGGAPGDGASYIVPTMGDFTMCRFSSGAGSTGGGAGAGDPTPGACLTSATAPATVPGISPCVYTTVCAPARLIFTL